MELGNLMFGNSRGNYEIDRKKYQDIFLEWLDAHGFDGYGLAADAQMAERFTSEGEDTRFENDVFVIRPYYWGEDARIAAKPNFGDVGKVFVFVNLLRTQVAMKIKNRFILCIFVEQFLRCFCFE